MEKYIGIVKKTDEFVSGINKKLLVKFYDNMEDMNQWFSLYPDCYHIWFYNCQDLVNVFYSFLDKKAVTQEEKKNEEKAKTLYKKLMSD
ncbi:MAG: hypothetical protein K6E99_00100 [Bacilli bacterium]|nr:hypothetical protein [Bacilli bacterium]